MQGLTQGLHRAARTSPDGLAVAAGSRRRTWREVIGRVARLAAALGAQGVTPGERVAILALNSDRYIELLYGVLWAGGVIVPLNTRWSAAEIADALADCQASVLVVDDRFADLAGELTAAAVRLIHAGDGPIPTGAVGLEALIADTAPMPDAGRSAGDLAGIFYTGGTTGRSKGVMLSHGAIVANGLACLSAFQFDPTTRFLHVAPMFHTADAACVFMVTLAGGAHLILPSFDPLDVCAIAAAHGVTDTLLVPTMIQALLDFCEAAGVAPPALRQVIYGASPMPEPTLRRLIRAMPSARLAQGFGQTELSPIATILAPEDHVLDGPATARLRSAGRAVAGVELKIVDADGRDCEAGETGEIWVRGPNVMQGYWKRPEQTAEVLVDGWLRTGDGGRLDADGYLFVVDRVKDMIISGGENVYSTEVENALQSHPAVLACAVIGVPDDRWGERVHAVIVPRPGQSPSLEDLAGHCRGLIAAYKHPRSLELRRDLPLSAAGKVLKAVLREPHWRALSRAVN